MIVPDRRAKAGWPRSSFKMENDLLDEFVDDLPVEGVGYEILADPFDHEGVRLIPV